MCLIQRSTELHKLIIFSLCIFLFIKAEVLIHDRVKLILDLVQLTDFLYLLILSCKGDWVVTDNKLTLGIFLIVPVAFLLVKSCTY